MTKDAFADTMLLHLISVPLEEGVTREALMHDDVLEMFGDELPDQLDEDDFDMYLEALSTVRPARR